MEMDYPSVLMMLCESSVKIKSRADLLDKEITNRDIPVSGYGAIQTTVQVLAHVVWVAGHTYYLITHRGWKKYSRISNRCWRSELS